MGDLVQGTGPTVPNGEACDTCSNGASITRRSYLLMGGALAVMAGCVGDDESPEDDSGTVDEDDTETADDAPADDGESDDEADMRDVQEDFDSFILEMHVTLDGPEESWEQELYRETDVVNEHLYQHIEMVMDEDSQEFEHYLVDEGAYQIIDDACMSFDEQGIMVFADNPGGFQRPDPDRIDAEDDHITHVGSDVRDGMSVDVWEMDLAQTFEAHDGLIRMYIDIENGYFVGYDGWYTTGAADDPQHITIDFRRHSFNEELTIELPEVCEDA